MREVLAPRVLPDEYVEWNRAHGAPFGRGGSRRRVWSRFGKARSARYCGPYGWQKNNSTRRYEYPWAYEQVRRLGDGLTIADIGAGLAGLQFTLACAGYDVHAVD